MFRVTVRTTQEAASQSLLQAVQFVLSHLE